MPQWCTSFGNAEPPKGCITFLNSTTNWVPNIQKLEPIKFISHSKYYNSSQNIPNIIHHIEELVNKCFGTSYSHWRSYIILARYIHLLQKPNFQISTRSLNCNMNSGWDTCSNHSTKSSWFVVTILKERETKN